MTKLTVQHYDGGKEVVIEHAGRQVSIAVTDSGVYDAQGDNGKTLATSLEPQPVSDAALNYLNGG
jgi:hypothetical protein